MAVFKQADPIDVVLEPELVQTLDENAALLSLGMPSLLALLLAERKGPEVLQRLVEKRVGAAVAEAELTPEPPGAGTMLFLAYPSAPNWRISEGRVEVDVDLKSIRDGTVIELFHFTLRFSPL